MPNPKSKIQNLKSITLRALHAEWRKLSPDLTGPEGLTERELRLYWTNSHLGKTHGRSVNSWNELSERQARFILKEMREATGDAAAWRAKLIERAAMMLWGEMHWASSLAVRMHDRFPQTPDVSRLAPADAHALIEELISRIARKEVATAGDDVRWEVVEHKIEEVRRRFTTKRTGNREQGTENEVAQGPLSGPAALPEIAPESPDVAL